MSLSGKQVPALQNRSFLCLLTLVTVGFGWILWPMLGAILWGVALAIVFRPLYLRLLRKVKRPNVAGVLTILIIMLLVVLPMVYVTAALVREATVLFELFKSGRFDFHTYVQQVYAATPRWMMDVLERLGLQNLSSLQDRLGAALNQISQFVATKALGFGQDTFDFVVSFFVMLYLLFFLMRDGEQLSKRIRDALPLQDAYKRQLGDKFRTVIRATVKGNIVVAALQGALGGLAFWVLGIHAPVLWAVLMGFLSLLPAVGAALVWAPVAIYLLAAGSVGAGVGLILYGTLVIGLVDNVLRPLLVGKDTKMPDYVVLMTTIGGMAVFGINGFVIGPLIAAMFIAVWDIVAAERRYPDDRTG
ncbi:Predicted PurR-regulated permease PerM [Roseateles sp. YR242]|uniref:AI-2E family transporter n=1 Tax=Roseateles sp. YR242 TaxID=1855305 RepID=UPI0008B6DCB1|nr:AI-2E family transporter [Roseateles sp. YR242]SEK59829.1 Predicted PurR-regulated permease PerM [Roseateles sp. YR242]